MPQESGLACGLNGAACSACPSGLCDTGVCVPVVGSGKIGDPCTVDADCRAVPLQAGYSAFCKTRTVPGGLAYPGGYCTRRCVGSFQCPRAVCGLFLGPQGEVENICLASCGMSGCRLGYACFNFGTMASPAPGCWLLPGGAPPALLDAGPGASGAAGGPCTSDQACRPPDDGTCTPELGSDGGPTGYPGGECSASCALALSDAWCGDGGSCIGSVGPSDSRGPTVDWRCERTCTTGGSSCRAGYVCAPFTTTTSGACVPSCTNPGFGCGARACDAATGLCQ